MEERREKVGGVFWEVKRWDAVIGGLVSGAEDLWDEGGELIGEVGFEHLNDIGEAAGFEVFDGRSGLSDDELEELIEAGLDDGIAEGGGCEAEIGNERGLEEEFEFGDEIIFITVDHDLVASD